MAENEGTPEYDCRDYFKEAVCIDAMRIYDSCSEEHGPGKQVCGRELPLGAARQLIPALTG